jgi:excisionase family DNA binding protein
MADTSAGDPQGRRSGRHRNQPSPPAQLPLEWFDAAARAAASEAKRTSRRARRPARATLPAPKSQEHAAERTLLLRVPEVGRILQIGRRQAWELVWRGELPAVRIGRRTVRVTRADLERFVDERPGAYGT